MTTSSEPVSTRPVHAHGPHILLCSAWQIVNIGDIAHTPAALAVLETHFPEAKVTLWPFKPLTPAVTALIMRRFPHLQIVEGTADANGVASNTELQNAMDQADFFLHSSGPATLGWDRAEAFHARTGRPFGVYGVTYGLYGVPEKATLSRARFVYFRDSVSLPKAQQDGVQPPIMEWSPDVAFATDLADDVRAEAFLQANGMEEGKFLCCISRLRNTPFWKMSSHQVAFDEAKHARNEAMKGHDHAPLIEAIVAVIRQTSLKILICPEDETQMEITRDNLLAHLPDDVRERVVWRDKFWLPDEALSVYRRSAGLFGHEMHSPIMCIGNGIPAIVCRWAEQSSKGYMWRDIGLGEWLFDFDNEQDCARLPQAVLALALDPASAKQKAQRAREVVFARLAETIKVVRSEAYSSQASRILLAQQNYPIDMTPSKSTFSPALHHDDYSMRVYAGVLGKIIGVYLGRPFEQWSYEKIEQTFGDVNFYVHDKVGVPLIVTDDDITGTFTFVRALEDNGLTTELTAQQIGWNWLNYIIENRTILWWGGLGYAAEHTAFLRLKAGIPAPQSGSLELNGWQVAEEIGSQIFIEGWALVAPGNPGLAAELARKAASVSHDREAIYGAQVIAVIAAQAFVEPDLNALIDLALTFIPSDSQIALCIADVRAWHQSEPDWRVTRQKIVEKYGYERYGTNCPIVSNHAIVMLGLLYGEDDFSKSLQITCNAAYDTDCNAANVGAILGIKNGLAGIDKGPHNWRGPVADRLYLPTAEGGSCFSDALTVSQKLVNMGLALAGLVPQSPNPKQGARYHFSQPGSVQGFVTPNEALQIENIERGGTHQLQLRALMSDGGDAVTETFVAGRGGSGGYDLIGNPSLFAGQTLHASIEAPTENRGALQVALVIYRHGHKNELFAEVGPVQTLPSGQKSILEWHLPNFDGQPIAKAGLRLVHAEETDRLWLDYYTWTGEPNVSFHPPQEEGHAWRRAWVNAVDTQFDWDKSHHVIIQNRGRGLISTGTSDWKNYRATARFKLRAAQGGGLAVRYGGLERYYGLMLRRPGRLTLFKRRDGVETVLGEIAFDWQYEPMYDLFLAADGPHLTAGVNDQVLLQVTDDTGPFLRGGIALLIEEGCFMSERVTVAPLG